MKVSFLTEEEITEIGFKHVGKNVLISRFACFYSPGEISIGNHVRIDDFCILSGKISIGNYVHISAYNALYGAYGIEIADYAGISPRCTIFSATDDFSGESMIGPMIPEEYTNVSGGPVVLKKYVQIGASSTVLPNVVVETGSVVGSMSLVKNNIQEWGIYAGIPVKRIKDRSKKMLKFVIRGS